MTVPSLAMAQLGLGLPPSPHTPQSPTRPPQRHHLDRDHWSLAWRVHRFASCVVDRCDVSFFVSAGKYLLVSDAGLDSELMIGEWRI
jgi:hypothetical protein